MGRSHYTESAEMKAEKFDSIGAVCQCILKHNMEISYEDKVLFSDPGAPEPQVRKKAKSRKFASHVRSASEPLNHGPKFPWLNLAGASA
eukprot:SAG11_NODE_4706_length_1797_cov_1.388693_2_plen_89_part_00